MVENIFKSFAKVNLYLRLLGARNDGYTEIRTVFQTIGLYDVLRIKTLKSREINLEVHGDYSVPSDEGNLIVKAANLIKEKCEIDKGVKIVLEKNIPVGAGLGGGSSNCAVTLLALNKIWGLNLSFQNLCELASMLGSDVPFFLRGGTAFGFGRGEEIIFLPDDYFNIKSKKVAIIVPDFSINTGWAYSLYKNYVLTKKKVVNKITCLNRDENFKFLNDFEEVLFEKFPVLLNLKKILLNYGANVCIISGSGSVLFALFETFKNEQEQLIEKSLPEGFKAFFTDFVDSKDYIKLVFNK